MFQFKSTNDTHVFLFKDDMIFKYFTDSVQSKVKSGSKTKAMPHFQVTSG